MCHPVCLPAARRESAKKCRNGPRMKTILAVLVVLISGCTVGPNFVRPVAPHTDGYVEAPAAASAGAAANVPADVQHIVLGGDVAPDWWTLFHSDALDDLIREAIAGSPTLVAAQSTLAQAQELTAAAGGARYPQVDLTGGA